MSPAPLTVFFCPTTRRAHFIWSKGRTPVSRSLPTAPVPGSRVGCSPICRLLVIDGEDDAEPPFDHVGERRHRGELRPPVGRAGEVVDMGHRPAPAGRRVVLDQPVDQRLARHHLDARIERGTHREAALVERLLAVHVVQLAAYFLGEIIGREDVRPGRARLDAERLLLGVLTFRRGGVAVLDHAVDDPVAALERAVGIAEGL